MDKQALFKKIENSLEESIRVIKLAISDAQEEARGNDNLPASQSDNRALEASRLADAQQKRMLEAQVALKSIQSIPVSNYNDDDGIGISTYVEVESDKQCLHFVIAPNAGGTIVEFEGKQVELISPQSPLGEALLDQRIGDSVLVETPKGEKEYIIKAAY